MKKSSEETVVQMDQSCDTTCFHPETVYRVSAVVKQEPIKTTADLFKALGDETRLKVAFALTQEEKLCVCDMAHILGSSTATASHHLRYLRKQGLAKSHQEGKQVYYSLEDEHVKTLLSIGIVHSKEVNSRV